VIVVIGRRADHNKKPGLAARKDQGNKIWSWEAGASGDGENNAAIARAAFA